MSVEMVKNFDNLRETFFISAFLIYIFMCSHTVNTLKVICQKSRLDASVGNKHESAKQVS